MKYQSTDKLFSETVIKADEVDLTRMSAGNISTRAGEGPVGITASEMVNVE